MTLVANAVDEDLAPEDVVSKWHELLKEPGAAEATYDELVSGQRELGLAYGERPLTRVLRPRLVTAAEHRYVAEAAEQVARAARRLAAQLLSPDSGLPAAVRDSVVLGPAEKALAQLPYPEEGLSPLGRLDGFGFGPGLRFVEYNADSAACMMAQEQLAQVYRTTTVLKQLGTLIELRSPPLLDAVVALLLNAWRQAGEPGESPCVAVVDWPEGSWLGEFDLLCAAFEARGIPAFVCPPEALSFARGRLSGCTAEGAVRPVTLVYRRVLVTDLHRRLGVDVLQHPLVRAAAEGACAVVNPLAADLAQRKSLFGLLSDERVLNWLPREEASAVARHVPWSRPLSAGRTTYAGEEVDLLPFARRHRRRLVLKPDNSYAGHGVVCGWQTSAAAWESALAKALTARHVLQERVNPLQEDVPFLVEGRPALQSRIMGTDPMLLDGRVSGFLSRISSNAVISVSAGGDLLPVFTCGA
ncbi:hypothetical protein ACQPZG_04605 (plasmid) [Streptomyces sp. CA-294286]|uniref:hypothetical protein n=1 Tax=Streptomyces sp. CA-294286 TaxID=3240070 RepID=UPI003D8C39B8